MTRPKCPKLGGGVVERVILDAVQGVGGVIPIVRIAHRDQVRAEVPAREPERAVRHHDSRFGVLAPVQLQGRTVDRKGRRVGEDAQEIRRGMSEFDHQRERILGVNAQCGRGRPARHDVRCAAHGRQNVGILRGRARIHQSAPGGGEVLGDHGLAVGPARSGPQVKAIGQAVAGDVAAVGARQNGQAVGADGGQSFIEIPQDRQRGFGPGGVQIEALRLRPVATAQDGAVPRALPAGPESQRRQHQRAEDGHPQAEDGPPRAQRGPRLQPAPRLMRRGRASSDGPAAGTPRRA